MRKFIILISLSLLIPFNINSANIIFDLGNVLINTNEVAAWWYVGPMNVIWYLSTFKSSLSVKMSVRKLFFDFLLTTEPRKQHEVHAKDNTGMLLPQLMCDWLKGTKSCEEIGNQIRTSLKNNQSFFNNSTEQQLIRAIAAVTFNPALLIKTQKVIDEGIACVKECIARGHRVFILSNWDPASFTLLYNQFPQLFELFDGIIISGNVGIIKPDPAIYHKLLRTYNLNPHECVLIDDRIENITTAFMLGMHGILCPQKHEFVQHVPDFTTVREQLYAWEATVLPQATSKLDAVEYT